MLGALAIAATASGFAALATAERKPLTGKHEFDATHKGERLPATTRSVKHPRGYKYTELDIDENGEYIVPSSFYEHDDYAGSTYNKYKAEAQRQQALELGNYEAAERFERHRDTYAWLDIKSNAPKES